MVRVYLLFHEHYDVVRENGEKIREDEIVQTAALLAFYKLMNGDVIQLLFAA